MYHRLARRPFCLTPIAESSTTGTTDKRKAPRSPSGPWSCGPAELLHRAQRSPPGVAPAACRAASSASAATLATDCGTPEPMRVLIADHLQSCTSAVGNPALMHAVRHVRSMLSRGWPMSFRGMPREGMIGKQDPPE